MPKILFLDIETKPAIVASFGIRDQHINHGQILEAGGVICVGVKWRGEKRTQVFSDWEHGHVPMLEAVHAMLTEADAVGTYNGAAFDIPMLDGEFALANMALPPAPTHIDLFKTIRKMRFLSSKLDYILPLFGLGGKVKHEGFPLWLKVMQDDPKAQRKMARYCAGDVRRTEELYERILPYIKDHPHLGFTPKGSCGACGSTRMQRRGPRRTKASIIQRLQCQDCGSWQSGERSKAA